MTGMNSYRTCKRLDHMFGDYETQIKKVHFLLPATLILRALKDLNKMLEINPLSVPLMQSHHYCLLPTPG